MYSPVIHVLCIDGNVLCIDGKLALAFGNSVNPLFSCLNGCSTVATESNRENNSTTSTTTWRCKWITMSHNINALATIIFLVNVTVVRGTASRDLS